MKIMDKLEEWLAGTLLLVVFLIIIAQILANQPFRAPFIWSETLAQLLFVYIWQILSFNYSFLFRLYSLFT